MAFKSTLVFLLACQHICCVMAAECTTAIVASIFGTIGVLLVIAAIVALVWYCYRRRLSGKKKMLTVVLVSRLCKTFFLFYHYFLKGAAHIIHVVFIASFASTSSADSVSDPEFSFGGKKGGEIGLNGSGTPVTFSHRYSEKAPSAGKKLQIQATQYTIANKAFL